MFPDQLFNPKLERTPSKLCVEGAEATDLCVTCERVAQATVKHMQTRIKVLIIRKVPDTLLMPSASKH